MLAFPGMLVGPASRAGMKVPPNPEDFDRDQYPHFFVFCAVQLGRRMSDPGQAWDNAEVLAAIPEDEIKTLTLMGLMQRGLHYDS